MRHFNPLLIMILHHIVQSIDSIPLAKTFAELEAKHQEILGKNGLLSSALKQVGQLPPAERKSLGMQMNQLKERAVYLFKSHGDRLKEITLNHRLQQEKIDVTLPSRCLSLGKIHPITHTINQLLNYFAKKGFQAVFGPQIESTHYNFDALNIPLHHPARHNNDTFYVDIPKYLLRTHTSNVQIRTMEKTKAPFRFISCGRVYRRDYDATHTPMFHQLEGMVIENSINFGHLKSVMIDFCKDFFAIPNLPIRFRPSFFPFTEPSAEVDIGCSITQGRLTIGQTDQWMEILGCGMVHPNVLEGSCIDPDHYQGFAFGIGIERLVMLKYGFSDIRQLYSGDSRWIQGVGF